MESPSLVIVVRPRSRVLIACVTHEAGEDAPFDERRVGLDHVALSDLAHQLLNATAQDIEAITHTPANLPS